MEKIWRVSSGSAASEATWSLKSATGIHARCLSLAGWTELNRGHINGQSEGLAWKKKSQTKNKTRFRETRLTDISELCWGKKLPVNEQKSIDWNYLVVGQQDLNRERFSEQASIRTVSLSESRKHWPREVKVTFPPIAKCSVSKKQSVVTLYTSLQGCSWDPLQLPGKQGSIL